MYKDGVGDCDLINHTTGLKGQIKFYQRGWNHDNAGKVEGFVYDHDSQDITYKVDGKFHKELFLTDMAT